jgi:PAS domain S-box-containing protein
MSDPVLDQAAEDAGVTDFLVKHEVDGPMLARAVRFALRRRSDRRALRRSEQRYRELVRALPDTSALVVDAGLRFVAAGGEALEGAGVDVQALVGRSVPEVLAELGYAEFLEDYEAALAGERRTVERTIGGRSYRTSFRPLFVDGDRVLEAIVITVDLTERLRIATDLERAQAIAKTGSWYWDAPAQELFWSPELRRIYGMAPDAPMPTFGEYLRTMIVTADDRAAILEVTRRAQERLEDAELEFTIRRPDGERRVLATRVRCVSGPDGELWRIEGISQDVTALRSAWGGRAPELGLAGP